MSALIIGCGYLGRVLARQLREDGMRVLGTVRRDSSVEASRDIGIEAVGVDITASDGVGRLVELAGTRNVTDVYACVPPGIDADPVAVFTTVAAALRALPLRRALLTSSTAVYGDHDGARVDADTPIDPSDPRGRRLFDIERAWMSIGQTARIVRLAGLYGPGRVIGASAIRNGTAIGGNPDDILNLIHVEDAAALLRAVSASDTAATIELGADGVAMTRRDYYNTLASLLATRALFETNGGNDGASRRTGSRRCDIDVTCRRTGWHPRLADARLQLATLLPAAS